VVAIDGPGSSGKGTLGKLLAEKMDYIFVDTGAMYRALAVRAQQLDLDAGEEERLGALARKAEVIFRKPPPGDRWPFRIHIDGHDVTSEIRTPSIDMASSRISAYREVHEAMVEKQRELARSGGVVMEGRDIGTVVAPDADIKFYLTASVEERARRRYRQMQGWGREADLKDLEEQLRQRDRADSQRDVAPLKPAEDAIVIDTTSLSIEQVLEEMTSHVSQLRQKQKRGCNRTQVGP
jgi:cytidylate kinase